jgi:serine/threonine protein kinase
MATNKLNIDDIYFTALEKTDGKGRAAYLDEACGSDSELRARVERLLSAQPKVNSFLESPAPGINGFPTVDHPITEQPGTQIGACKLLQQIGEGGFGVVYMAEQTEPVRRKVALKIIKPGMDSKEVIARFEAERQALALMDHPNIAKVLDGGTTDAGLPYFVMELVKGIPVTQFCDENQLDTERRLQLFVTICRAIQHAHQKGVIHRDIKPNNVLVTLHDGEPVPMVIDFGVAKAISQQLTEKTMFTAFGQMIGTPQYMSPEQAEMSGLDVDTRSDIYSLGVLLYELLTGTTPLDPKRLRETAFHELQRIIREEEPPRPSARLTTLQEQSATIASNRGTVPNKLGSLVRGDLDWIVMRSLEKNRERRYDTPNALADDIRRFLSSEPVEACPPSLLYKVAKFARRNKATLVTTATIAAALLIGLTFAVCQAVRATNERNRAIALEIEAHQAARQAVEEAERANQAEKKATTEAHLAEENEQAVSSVIDFLVKEIISQADPFQQHNRDLTIGQLLEQISNSSETEFPREPRAEAALRHYLGVICHRAGLIEEAEKHLSRALELRRNEFGEQHVETARTEFALAYALTAIRDRYSPLEVKHARRVRIEQLLPAATKKLERSLGPRDPETLRAMALQILGLTVVGEHEKATELYQIAKDRVPENLTSDPSDPLDLNMSIFVLLYRRHIGNDQKVDDEIAERYRIVCRDLPPEHPTRAFWTEWYGQMHYFRGNLDEANAPLKEAYEMRKKVLGESNYFSFLAGRAMAALLARQDRIDEAIALLEALMRWQPQHTAQALNLSVLYLHRNRDADREKWLKIATRLLNDFEDTDNPATINNVLSICLACTPQSQQERDMQNRAIDLADRFAAQQLPPRGYVPQRRDLTIALAQYRENKNESAQQLLHEVEQGPLYMFRAISLAMQAAIVSRQGDRQLADELVERARAAEAQAPESEIHNHQYFCWNRPFLLDFLINEARQPEHATEIGGTSKADEETEVDVHVDDQIRELDISPLKHAAAPASHFWQSRHAKHLLPLQSKIGRCSTLPWNVSRTTPFPVVLDCTLDC